MAVVAVVAYMLRPYEPVIYEPGTIIYQSENITAKVVEPIYPYQEVMPYYPSASAEEVFGGASRHRNGHRPKHSGGGNNPSFRGRGI